MRQEVKTKAASLSKVIVLLMLSVFMFGIGLLWIFTSMGFGGLKWELLISQVAILFYGLSLFDFNDDLIKSELSKFPSLSIFCFDKKDLRKESSLRDFKITILFLFTTLIAYVMLSIRLTSSFRSVSTDGIVSSESIVATIILPIIVAPIVEELTFRAGLKYALVGKGGWSPSSYLIISSLLFGFMHWQAGGLGYIPVILIGLVGLIFGTMYLKTGSIYIPIMSHMLYNGFTITVALLK